MPSWPADHVWVTILAGGIGSRFWPASTRARPKQLLPLASNRPLIVDTVERARGLVPDARIRLLTGGHLVPALRAALPELHDDCYLVEPEARGTAPVLAWAAHTLHARDPDAVLVSLHADHLIRPREVFLTVLRQATELAGRRSMLVTLGAVPDRAETGYGYLQAGEPIDERAASARRVVRFHEKPDASTAAEYVARGYLWNTGIFVWPAGVFLDEIRRHAPEISGALHRLDDGDVEGFFAACPTVSVDVAVLERSANVAVLPATFSWDDVGSWESLARTRSGDAEGNVAVGEAHVVEGAGNVVYTDGAPVVLFGVDDLVVVRTADVTLVTRRNRAADLKSLLAALPRGVADPERAP